MVTNHHVVAQADKITLTFHDGSEHAANVVGSDPQTDIAVLKTDKQDLKKGVRMRVKIPGDPARFVLLSLTG